MNTYEHITAGEIEEKLPPRCPTLWETIVKQGIPNWRAISIPNLPEAIHMLGMSGGVDSSVAGIVLTILFPRPFFRFHGMFTDTGDEPASLPELFDLIEKKTNLEIEKIKDEDLYEILDESDYLPAIFSRWCTLRLKITPFNNRLQELREGLSNPSTPIFAYSGIRWDERDRLGMFDLKGVETVFPFINRLARVDRAMVGKIAAQTGTMNSSYLRGRGRSGCESCFLQSLQEKISLLIWNPEKFDKVGAYEKVPDHLLERFDADKNFPIKPKGFYTLYPVSSLVSDGKSSLEAINIYGEAERVDEAGRISWDYELVTQNKKKRKKVRSVTGTHEENLSLFDSNDFEAPIDLQEVKQEETTRGSDNGIVESKKTIFVAIEHFVSGSCGVLDSKLITYSTSKSGLTRSLHSYYYHRSNLAYGLFVSPDNYDRTSHITVLSISFDEGILPTIDYKAAGGFGWSDKTRHGEIALIVRWIQRACELFRAKQILKEGRRTHLTQIAKGVVENHIKHGQPHVGEVTGIGHYRPKPFADQEIDDSYDYSVETARCAICS